MLCLKKEAPASEEKALRYGSHVSVSKLVQDLEKKKKKP